MHTDAYQEESLDYTIKELIPDASTLKLIGIKDSNKIALKFSSKALHPTFLKALQHKYHGCTSDDIYKYVAQGYMEAWLNKTSRTVSHHEVWSQVFKLSTSRAAKLEKSIFPHDNLKGFEGVAAGTLYFADVDAPIAQSMSYRSVNKLLGEIYEDRKDRETASQNYLQAFIDYGKEAQDISKESIRNLVAFYNEVNTRESSVAFKTWIDKETWEFYKYFIFEQANALSNANFTKFIESDLPVNYWEDHVDMPREWLLNLYRN
jgi:hypothetical protein